MKHVRIYIKIDLNYLKKVYFDEKIKCVAHIVEELLSKLFDESTIWIIDGTRMTFKSFRIMNEMTSSIQSIK